VDAYRVGKLLVLAFLLGGMALALAVTGGWLGPLCEHPGTRAALAVYFAATGLHLLVFRHHYARDRRWWAVVLSRKLWPLAFLFLADRSYRYCLATTSLNGVGFVALGMLLLWLGLVDLGRP
jgi:hypothetical protein